MAFDLVIGHETPKARLMDALLGDRLAHAYLFYGSSGTGSEALAIELAKAINCEKGLGEPCQQCKSCRGIANLQHPDVHVYLPSSSVRSTRAGSKSGDETEGADDRGGRRDARSDRRLELITGLSENPYATIPFRKSDFLSIDDIRELRQEASITPFEGRRKIVFIFAADRMNTAASNALLKTLEEPPGTLLLILVTDRIHRLLPTIVSRCQPVYLARLPDDTLHDALMNRFEIDPGRAGLAVRQADGSVGTALRSVSDEGETYRSTAFGFIEAIHGGSLIDLFEKVEQLVAFQKDAPILEGVLDTLLGYYRDLFLMIETGDEKTIQHVDKNEWLSRTAQRLSFDQVHTAISAVEEIKQAITQNAHVQLALTVLALRLRTVAGSTS